MQPRHANHKPSPPHRYLTMNKGSGSRHFCSVFSLSDFFFFFFIKYYYFVSVGDEMTMEHDEAGRRQAHINTAAAGDDPERSTPLTPTQASAAAWQEEPRKGLRHLAGVEVRLATAGQTGSSPLPAAECSRVPVSVHYGNIPFGRDLASNTFVCECSNTC